MMKASRLLCRSCACQELHRMCRSGCSMCWNAVRCCHALQEECPHLPPPACACPPCCQVNAMAPMRLIRALAPKMADKARGCGRLGRSARRWKPAAGRMP